MHLAAIPQAFRSRFSWPWQCVPLKGKPNFPQLQLLSKKFVNFKNYSRGTSLTNVTPSMICRFADLDALFMVLMALTAKQLSKSFSRLKQSKFWSWGVGIPLTIVATAINPITTCFNMFNFFVFFFLKHKIFRKHTTQPTPVPLLSELRIIRIPVGKKIKKIIIANFLVVRDRM